MASHSIPMKTSGLLLNMLGHEAPRGSLAGLDGVLIGLRTRDLVRRMVQARSRLAPLILLFEDIIGSTARLRRYLA